jgi:transposase
MVVVTDHDSKVLARKTFRCRAWDLGVALDWAADRAKAKGFAGVTVACEPTGHRWRVLGSSPNSVGCRSCACSRC